MSSYSSLTPKLCSLLGKTERGKNYVSGRNYLLSGEKKNWQVANNQIVFQAHTKFLIQLDELEEAFRYGEEIDEGKIIYGEIGLFYAEDETRITRGNLDRRRFVLITCWKGGERSNVRF
jgi:hypothetical protein